MLLLDWVYFRRFSLYVILWPVSEAASFSCHRCSTPSASTVTPLRFRSAARIAACSCSLGSESAPATSRLARPGQDRLFGAGDRDFPASLVATDARFGPSI